MERRPEVNHREFGRVVRPRPAEAIVYATAKAARLRHRRSSLRRNTRSSRRPRLSSGRAEVFMSHAESGPGEGTNPRSASISSALLARADVYYSSQARHDLGNKATGIFIGVIKRFCARAVVRLSLQIVSGEATIGFGGIFDDTCSTPAGPLSPYHGFVSACRDGYDGGSIYPLRSTR